MVSYKIKKKWYKDLTLLLTEVGAVFGNQAFPSNVFVNPIDYNKIKRGTREAFLREMPYLKYNKRKLNSAIAMHLLNLGPIPNKAVVSGYVIVNTRGITIDRNEYADKK